MDMSTLDNTNDQYTSLST